MDPQPLGGLATSALQDIERLWQVVMSELSDASREAYSQDAEAFRKFLEAPTREAAAAALLMAGPVGGNAMVARFRAALEREGKAPATVARRMACLKSMVRTARILGICTWMVEVRSPNRMILKDTRGPGPDRIGAMMEAAVIQEDQAKGKRDCAILHLLYDMGLRRGEVAAIQFPKQVEMKAGKGGALWIKGKGRREAQLISMGPETAAPLAEWIAVRGDWEGPLFIRMDNAEPANWRKPLTGRAIHYMVRGLALALGFSARPHGLRHSAITEVLDATNGDLRTTKKFSRHSSFDMVERYDDNRKELGAEVSTMLSKDLLRRRRPA